LTFVFEVTYHCRNCRCCSGCCQNDSSEHDVRCRIGARISLRR